MVAETTTGLLIGFEEAKVCKILAAVLGAVGAAIETDELDIFMITKFSEESLQKYGIDGCFSQQCMVNLTYYIIVLIHL